MDSVFGSSSFHSSLQHFTANPTNLWIAGGVVVLLLFFFITVGKGGGRGGRR